MIECTLYLHLSPNSVEFFNFSTRHFGDVSLRTVGIHLVTHSSFFSSPLPSLLPCDPRLAPLALLSLPSSAQRCHFRPALASVPTEAPQIGKKFKLLKGFTYFSLPPRFLGDKGSWEPPMRQSGFLHPRRERLNLGLTPAFLCSYRVINAHRNACTDTQTHRCLP